MLDEPIEIGLIAGIGQTALLEDETRIDLPTPFGSTSEPIRIGALGGRRVAMIVRRGEHEVLQPHLVPYRANVWALASLGVRSLISTTASSGLREAYSPGTFVVGDQVIDRTAARPSTFFDTGAAVQLAAAELFDPTLRALAAEVLAEQRVRYQDFGTTVVINGPRFSTAAEARWHAMVGADMVNMTLMPETPLALELGLAVVNVALVTDRDAGTAADHSDATSLDLVRLRVAHAQPALARVLQALTSRIPAGYAAKTAIPGDRIAAVLRRPARSEPAHWAGPSAREEPTAVYAL